MSLYQELGHKNWDYSPAPNFGHCAPLSYSLWYLQVAKFKEYIFLNHHVSTMISTDLVFMTKCCRLQKDMSTLIRTYVSDPQKSRSKKKSLERKKNRKHQLVSKSHIHSAIVKVI